MARHGAPTANDHYRVVAELNREWATMRDDHDEVHGWAARHLALAGCVDLPGALGAVADAPDEVLLALLIESRCGSVLAARTVLQAMLGKVVLMTRADPATGVQVYLAAMWERIRTYPIERRPRHIAANLTLDARKLARRDQARNSRATVTPMPPGGTLNDLVERQHQRDLVDHARDVSVLTAGDIIKAALELELIDTDAGRLLGSVYSNGLPSKDAAARHSMSASNVRRRCSAAVRHLARHASEIASIA